MELKLGVFCSFVGFVGAPSFPCLFNQPISSGSPPLLPAQEIWTPSNPCSFTPLAHTAPNASPIRLNGTSAVPSFTSSEEGFFFFEALALIESTIESLSVSPNGRKSAASDSEVVR